MMSCTDTMAAAADWAGLEMVEPVSLEAAVAGLVAGLACLEATGLAAAGFEEEEDAEVDLDVRELLGVLGAGFGCGGIEVHCSSSRSTRRSCCSNFLLPSRRPPPLAASTSLGLRSLGILRSMRRGADFFPSCAVSVAVLSCTTKSLNILRMQSLSADGAASGLLPGDATCAADAAGESKKMEPYWSSDQSSSLRRM